MNQHKSSLSSASAQPRLEGVAPSAILAKDFSALQSRSILRCSAEMEQILFLQSTEGHAHAGQGQFFGKTHPNTSQDDVAKALRFDPIAVKAYRQMLIDEVEDFIRRVAAGDMPQTACNADGEPLMRFGLLRFLPINPLEVVQGLFLGGLRDDSKIRELADSRYGVNIGYGEDRPVNQTVMKQLGLNGFDLAKRGHEQQMVKYENAGLFSGVNGGEMTYMFVRYRAGVGASDDCAIAVAGKLHGLSAGIGCMLADGVDTLEKYTPVYEDQDVKLSRLIGSTFPKLGVSRDDAVDLAYLCAIPENMRGKLPDCSFRHLLEIDRTVDQCAAESHIAYMMDLPVGEMDLDRGQCTNIELYAYINKRLSNFRKGRSVS